MARDSTSAVPANHPLIVYEGRQAAEASGAVRLGFPGVTVHVSFRGRGLTVRVDAAAENLYLDVRIDGAAPVPLRLRAGPGDYALGPDAAAAVHAVTLVRRNESWHGAVTLHGFDPGPGGGILPGPALPARKLLFIGDSVTCGEMAAYEPGRALKDYLNWSPRDSYGLILARRLGAQCHLVSYGGRGIIRDWQGIRATRNAPQFYELALPDGPAAAWDHACYLPDAIGIQLGTNDFNPGIPERDEFVNAYVRFIQKVRRDAPHALIFVMDSPIVRDDPVHGPRRTGLHGYLEQIVTRSGSRQVILAPLSHYPGVPDNGHPTGREHVAMADELEPLLRRRLGW